MSWWLLIPYALVLGLVLVTNPGQGLAKAGPSHAKLSRAIDINPDPDVFETIIVATEETVDLGDGLLANVYTYNGTVPGPEFHFKVGDRVIVHFTNFLPEPSSIHWHGVELNNASDGTPVTQNPVKFGETYTYRFVVPHPGVYWYHPHFKPTNPEFKGQYGSFIVEDPAEPALRAAGVIPNRGHTRTLVLSDTTVCKAPGENDTETFPTDDPDLPWSGGDEFPGQTLSPTPDKLCENPRDNVGNPLGTGPLAAGDIPNVQAADDCRFQKDCATNEGQLVLVNGKVPGAREGSPQDPGELMSGASVLNVKAGSGLRLQIIGATVTRYFRLLMTDQYGDPVPLYRIGGEGGLLDRVRVEGGTQQLLDTKYDSGEILLAPSDRADVVLVVPDGRPGDIVTLWTRDYPRTGRGFANIPTVPVLHLRIVGSANKSQRYAISDGDPLRVHPRVDDPTEDLRGLPITDHLLDPALLPVPLPGSPDETIRLRVFPADDRWRRRSLPPRGGRLRVDSPYCDQSLCEDRGYPRTRSHERDPRPPPLPFARLFLSANSCTGPVARARPHFRLLRADRYLQYPQFPQPGVSCATRRPAANGLDEPGRRPWALDVPLPHHLPRHARNDLGTRRPRAG
ncbi:MAG: multicopper oxidase domain-containing protein [Myxococcales bacterium]|nr:multicopper oxidase domain-containing protein [Myxococcales bacterium]